MSAVVKEDLQTVMNLCAEDTAVWCKTFFPKRFRRPFSRGHLDAFKLMGNPYIRKLLVICHRGWGKSSIMQLGIPSKSICLKMHDIIVPFSNTATLAEEKSERLKLELKTNSLVTSVFGDMEGSRWAREEWVTRNGVRVLPRGANQQIRGVGDDFRPDLLLPDDLETLEGTSSEEQRAKLKEWFFSDLMGCVDLGDKVEGENDWRIIMLGTPLHEAALLVELSLDPSWFVVRCPLFDDNMETLWPEFMSTERIKLLADEYRAQGKIDTFYREYGLKLISTEDASFSTRFFKYYDEAAAQLNQKNDVERIIIVDPAKTVSASADDTAIVGLAFSSLSNIVYVRDVMAGRFHPEETFNHLFAMAKRINAQTVGIEVTSLNEWIVWPLKNEILRRGLNLELVELKAKAKKEERITGLIPLYRQGLVYHNKNVTHKLEQQLLSFPRSSKWDVMDALAYVVSMLSKGDRYMTLQQSSDAEDKPIDLYSRDETIEDEYKELEYENALEDEIWMTV